MNFVTVVYLLLMCFTVAECQTVGCPGPLGMENGAISNSQISASSEYDSNHAPNLGRLHLQAGSGKMGAWSAATNDGNQWLQIDMVQPSTIITGVATQGRNGVNQWVTKYLLQYSVDGVNFVNHKENGNEEFDGNFDQDTIVQYTLDNPFLARYIRFRPTAWYGHISMRVEIFGCEGCRNALGMQSGAIFDKQISASSEYDSNHAAIQGRLYFQAGSGKMGAWSAATNDGNQWLQIDMVEPNTIITGMATQGRNGYDQWVTKYLLQYSVDGVNFLIYQENGQEEFNGNFDQNTVVEYLLDNPFKARYIRFRPTAWYGHISMRVEIVGCEVCSNALGMENGAIEDKLISASSEYDSNHAATQGRLHFQAGAWSAATNDFNQWLQIDMDDPNIRITGVATQGRNGYDQWVTKYMLQYSVDGKKFLIYKENGNQEFSGNADQNTVVYHKLLNPFKERYIRFVPTAWHNHISMRVEIYGCR